jgi:hypothetical protein
MSPANRTAQEIVAVRKALALGRISQAQADKKIASLEARGAAYEARWTLPNGKERTKTFSVKKHGKNAERKAEQHEALMKAQVASREHSDPHQLRTTVASILYGYRDAMKARSSATNVPAHVRDVVEFWGDRMTLEKLDRDPETLIYDLRAHLEQKHASKKTAYQRKITTRAAILKFLRKKRMRMVDPFLGIDWPDPKSKRNACPTVRDFEDLMREADRLVSHETKHGISRDGKYRKYPIWLPTLISLGRWHALRIGEFLSWRWEWTELEPTDGAQFAWVKTMQEKQHTEEPVFRELPLFKPAREALQAMPASNKEVGPIFPMGRETTDKWWRACYDAAGKQHLIFHDWRRLFDRENAHLSQRQRMELLGQKTERANDSYKTRLARLQMEALVADSYVREA